MDRFGNGQQKLYTIDEIRALAGGGLKHLSKLLEVRTDGSIWWAVSRAERDEWRGDPEFDVLNQHPNRRPSTEPLLPAKFTAEQFVAFEDIVHLFRQLYLNGDGQRTPCDDDSHLDLVDHWTGLDEEAVEQLRLRSPHAVELVEALVAHLSGQVAPQDAVPLEMTLTATDPPARVYWKRLLFQHISAIDRLYGKKANAHMVTYLLNLGDPRVRWAASLDEFDWKDDDYGWHTVKKKTLKTAASAARKWAASRLPSARPT